MGVLALYTILGLKLGLVFGYAIEPTISWPTEYHFTGEKIDLYSGVVKPFEMWYSEALNKSRIDYYGGLISKIHDGTVEGNKHHHLNSTVYMFHPESDEAENSVVKCSKLYSRKFFEDFLPDLEDFVFSGHAHHSGKDVSVWKRDYSDPDIENVYYKETLYVLPQDDVAIPVQMETKRYNDMNDALGSHEIVNYDNYDSNVKDEDLTIDKTKCPGQNHSPIDWVHNRLSPHVDSDVEIAFNVYKHHHKREYKEAEHETRKQIYRRNWKLVQEHNSQNLGYKLAMNHFADRTESELRYLAATRYTKPVVGTHEFPYTAERIDEIAETLPEELDLRSEGFVSPVKSQAECGSCWAFAATSAVESAVMKSMDGHRVDLSEQSLVDCAWKFQISGCMGAQYLGDVFQYIKEYGIPTVRDYGPYLGEDGVCKINNMTDVYKIRGYVALPPRSAGALKVALFERGAVMVAVEASVKMYLYSSGVYYSPECLDEPWYLNHAVLAVGYGVRDGDLYWIIKNSWGENWGQDGYLLISANDNNCGVLSEAVYPIL